MVPGRAPLRAPLPDILEPCLRERQFYLFGDLHFFAIWPNRERLLIWLNQGANRELGS